MKGCGLASVRGCTLLKTKNLSFVMNVSFDSILIIRQPIVYSWFTGIIIVRRASVVLIGLDVCRKPYRPLF